MNRILAIAGLTFRTAVRSRVLVLLMAVVVISILWLPFIVRGDGTPAGTVRIYLQYALGWTVFLVSMTALWTGASAFSQEVENRQMQLIATKPVRALHLWAGKWLGLMFVNVMLLGLAGALAYAMLQWTTRPAAMTGADRQLLREEVLTARRAVALKPDTGAVRDAPRHGAARPRRIGVAPGNTLRWTFMAPERVRPDDTILVQYRFATSRAFEAAPSAMMWTVGPENDPDRYKVPADAAPNISHTFQFPAHILEPDAPMRITYHNVESERPAYTLFSTDDGVQLLVRAGGFEMNYVRALVMLIARLSFFSSLGLAAGALFSFPVAAFVSFGFLVVTGFARFIESVAAGGVQAVPELRAADAALFWDPLVQRIFALINLMIPPLWRYDPFDALSSGGLVAWGSVGSSVLVFIVAYSGILAVAGGWLFSRRELGS